MNSKNRIPIQLGLTVGSVFVCSVFVCLLVLVATGFSSTEVEANTTHCSLELDDEKRSACFESNPQQKHEQRLPGWPILNVRSYASGNPNASATRMAEEQVMCGDTEGTTSIGLHCVDDGMKLVFSMGCSFGQSNTPTQIELRAGGQSSEWKAKVFRNQLGMAIDDSITASKFVKTMQGNEKIVLIYSPMNAEKFAATFQLDGFDKAVDRIEALCPL